MNFKNLLKYIQTIFFLFIKQKFFQENNIDKVNLYIKNYHQTIIGYLNIEKFKNKKKDETLFIRSSYYDLNFQHVHSFIILLTISIETGILIL